MKITIHTLIGRSYAYIVSDDMTIGELKDLYEGATRHSREEYNLLLYGNIIVVNEDTTKRVVDFMAENNISMPYDNHVEIDTNVHFGNRLTDSDIIERADIIELEKSLDLQERSELYANYICPINLGLIRTRPIKLNNHFYEFDTIKQTLIKTTNKYLAADNDESMLYCPMAMPLPKELLDIIKLATPDDPEYWASLIERWLAIMAVPSAREYDEHMLRLKQQLLAEATQEVVDDANYVNGVDDTNVDDANYVNGVDDTNVDDANYVNGVDDTNYVNDQYSSNYSTMEQETVEVTYSLDEIAENQESINDTPPWLMFLFQHINRLEVYAAVMVIGLAITLLTTNIALVCTGGAIFTAGIIGCGICFFSSSKLPDELDAMKADSVRFDL